jgi:hypothetical protein
MKTSEVLRAAKARLEVPGVWGQAGCGGFGNKSRACTHLAVSEKDPLVTSVREQALGYLTHAIGLPPMPSQGSGLGKWYYAHRWNDAPERTHADVMAAFDRAIALALADEGTVVHEAGRVVPSLPHVVGRTFAQEIA